MYQKWRSGVLYLQRPFRHVRKADVTLRRQRRGGEFSASEPEPRLGSATTDLCELKWRTAFLASTFSSVKWEVEQTAAEDSPLDVKFGGSHEILLFLNPSFLHEGAHIDDL